VFHRHTIIISEFLTLAPIPKPADARADNMVIPNVRILVAQVAHQFKAQSLHRLIISEFLFRDEPAAYEQITESCWDDIIVVAGVATFPFLKRHNRLGIVAPLSEVLFTNAAGLRLSLRSAPDLAEDLLPGVFLIIRHTLIISEFLRSDLPKACDDVP